MKTRLQSLLATLLVPASLLSGPVEALPTGVNLTEVQPWSAQIMFVDVMKRSQEWTVFEISPTGGWGLNRNIPLRADGYPLELPYTPPGANTPLGVACYLFIDMDGHYPGGDYTLSFEGSGGMVVSNGEHEQYFSSGGTYSFNVDPQRGDLMLALIESNAADPIRNIRFVMPGFEALHQTQPFYPPFLHRLRDFQAVRLSQTMRTNSGEYPCDNGVQPESGACVKQWPHRNTTGFRTQASPRGVALEHLIDLANTSGVEPWFNIPHGADDDYVRNFARLVRDRLNPGLKFYIELSNELFNFEPEYPQNRWAIAAGLAQGLSSDAEIARQRFVAKRSAEIFHIFEQELGSQSAQRLVKVLPGWVAEPAQNQGLFTALADPTINPNNVRPDVFAIGPYFGGMVADVIHLQGENLSVSVPEIVQRAHDSILLSLPDPFDPGWVIESLESLVQANAQVAQANNIPMVAYEGGQHLKQTAGWNNEPVLGEKLMQANRHPDMGAAYASLHDIWTANGGGLMMHFNLIDRSTPWWGSFGLLEWTTQAPSSSVKYQAVLDWINP